MSYLGNYEKLFHIHKCRFWLNKSYFKFKFLAQIQYKISSMSYWHFYSRTLSGSQWKNIFVNVNTYSMKYSLYWLIYYDIDKLYIIINTQTLYQIDFHILFALYIFFCPGYDIKLHLMRLLSWKFGEYGVPLHCHDSQVFFDLE